MSGWYNVHMDLLSMAIAAALAVMFTGTAYAAGYYLGLTHGRATQSRIISKARPVTQPHAIARAIVRREQSKAKATDVKVISPSKKRSQTIIVDA